MEINRLTITTESRILGDEYVRFGGEYIETCFHKGKKGALCLAIGTGKTLIMCIAAYVRYAQSLEPESESRPSPSSSASLRKPIPIHLSHITPIYHFLYQLSVPHPSKVSWKETGNITFVLPNPAYGKNPEVYNYIGQESALTIEKEIEVEMRAELYEFLLENKFKNGIMFKRSMELFVEHYNMEGTVEEDSLMRAFKRWRKAMKDNRKY